jgi:GNAT superfamily N-acetyltransferase
MITIREASVDDAKTIIFFQQQMAIETEGLSLDEKILYGGVMAVFDDPSKGRYFVAENDGTVIASLLITNEWSDWRNAYVWWFQSVYVLPDYRRRGLFRSMYAYIRGQADIKGAAGLRLYVESNNGAARKTYEALGMTSEHYTMYEWLREN